MNNPAKDLIHWTRHLTDQQSGRRKLALASFLESTIVPVPLEVLVAPLMVSNPKRALSVAMAIWLGCLAGAALFYALALFLFEPVIQPALAALGLEGALAEMERKLGESGAFLAIFLVSITPVPFQVATLGAGAAGVNFLVFMAAVALSRGLRYFGLALLARLMGEALARKLTDPIWKVTTGIFVLTALWAGWYILT